MSQQDPNLLGSMYSRGAVDLSSLRAPAPPPPTAQDDDVDEPAGSSVAVLDVSEATFQSEVLERSRTQPVVIDFWAEWCGPCKQLSPILEKLAAEDGGRWVLAKIDVDANPRLSQMFQIQSIPTVYAVVGGQPVDGFSGVILEPQLRQWLDALLEAAAQVTGAPTADGLTAGFAPADDPRISDADELLAAGDLVGAEEVYREILAEQPGDELATSGLAQVGLLHRVQGVDARGALLDAGNAPDDVAAQTRAADVELMSGRAEEAYERLVELIRRTSGEDREATRRHLLSLFAIAGPDDPAVAVARRQLAAALF